MRSLRGKLLKSKTCVVMYFKGCLKKMALFLTCRNRRKSGNNCNAEGYSYTSCFICPNVRQSGCASEHWNRFKYRQCRNELRTAGNSTTASYTACDAPWINISILDIKPELDNIVRMHDASMRHPFRVSHRAGKMEYILAGSLPDSITMGRILRGKSRSRSSR